MRYSNSSIVFPHHLKEIYTSSILSSDLDNDMVGSGPRGSSVKDEAKASAKTSAECLLSVHNSAASSRIIGVETFVLRELRTYL